jgi:hypothetical protein
MALFKAKEIFNIDGVSCQKCSKCKDIKPLDGFYRCKITTSGRDSHCKECDGKAAREYRNNNPEKMKQIYRESRLKSKYGLSESKLNELMDSQNNKCNVCLMPFTETRRVCVDHCHSTDIVRGLLCDNCNRAEGALKTPEAAMRMAIYMQKNALFYANAKGY